MEGELVTEIGNKILNNNNYFIIIFNIENFKKIRCSEDLMWKYAQPRKVYVNIAFNNTLITFPFPVLNLNVLSVSVLPSNTFKQANHHNLIYKYMYISNQTKWKAAWEVTLIITHSIVIFVLTKPCQKLSIY